MKKITITDPYVISKESFFPPQNEESPLYTQSTNFCEESWHTHDVYEIVYMSEGELDHRVNNAEMNLSFGDIIFLRPNEVHSFINNKKSGIHRDLVFEKTFFKAFCDSMHKDIFNIYHSSPLPIKLNLSENRLLHLETLCQEYAQISPVYKEAKLTYAKFILAELLSLIFRKNVDSTQKPEYPPLVNQMLERFHMTLLYRAGLPIILAPFKYNKSYLCRLFKQHVGMTMTDYLNEHRLNFVATQLRLTNKSVTELCEESGFSSLPYLNKLFKQKYGLPPLKYRKAMKTRTYS